MLWKFEKVRKFGIHIFVKKLCFNGIIAFVRAEKGSERMFRMKFVAESRELVGDFWIVQCVPLTLGLDSAVREYSSGRKKCFFEKKS